MSSSITLETEDAFLAFLEDMVPDDFVDIYSEFDQLDDMMYSPNDIKQLLMPTIFEKMGRFTALLQKYREDRHPACSEKAVHEEIKQGNPKFKYRKIWSLSIRFVAPAAVLVILVHLIKSTFF